MAATLPIREALGIAVQYEKASSGMFSSFADDVVSLRRKGQTWKVLYKPGPLSEWVYGALMPLAAREFNLDYTKADTASSRTA